MKQCQIIFLLLIKILFSHGVIYDGACPNVNGIEGFQCSTQLIPGQYKVMAHLPVDYSTLNIFYSPFDIIDCVYYELSCSYTSETLIKLKLVCDVETGRPYYWSPRIALQCLPNLIDMGFETTSDMNQIQAFGLGLQVQCPDKLANFNTKIMISEKGFVVIYGCRDIDDGMQHEEGMWLLFPSKNISNYDSSFFDEALAMIEGTSATISDFGIAQYDQNVTCGCVDCDFIYSCPTTPIEYDESFYEDYYQFTMPVRAKSYDDYYYDDYYYYYDYPDYYYDYPSDNGTTNSSESVTENYVEMTSEETTTLFSVSSEMEAVTEAIMTTTLSESSSFEPFTESSDGIMESSSVAPNTYYEHDDTNDTYSY